MAYRGETPTHWMAGAVALTDAFPRPDQYEVTVRLLRDRNEDAERCHGQLTAQLGADLVTQDLKRIGIDSFLVVEVRMREPEGG